MTRAEGTAILHIMKRFVFILAASGLSLFVNGVAAAAARLSTAELMAATEIRGHIAPALKKHEKEMGGFDFAPADVLRIAQAYSPGYGTIPIFAQDPTARMKVANMIAAHVWVRALNGNPAAAAQLTSAGVELPPAAVENFNAGGIGFKGQVNGFLTQERINEITDVVLREFGLSQARYVDVDNGNGALEVQNQSYRHLTKWGPFDVFDHKHFPGAIVVVQPIKIRINELTFPELLSAEGIGLPCFGSQMIGALWIGRVFAAYKGETLGEILRKRALTQEKHQLIMDLFRRIAVAKRNLVNKDALSQIILGSTDFDSVPRAYLSAGGYGLQDFDPLEMLLYTKVEHLAKGKVTKSPLVELLDQGLKDSGSK